MRRGDDDRVFFFVSHFPTLPKMRRNSISIFYRWCNAFKIKLGEQVKIHIVLNKCYFYVNLLLIIKKILLFLFLTNSEKEDM
jgi:hypothetical protein